MKTKCDFCENESVGYTFMQASFYCPDHQAKAEEIEAHLINEVEKAQLEALEND